MRRAAPGVVILSHHDEFLRWISSPILSSEPLLFTFELAAAAWRSHCGKRCNFFIERLSLPKLARVLYMPSRATGL